MNTGPNESPKDRTRPFRERLLLVERLLMDYLQTVLQIVDSYKHLGEEVLKNGTRLIGHLPHVAPEAWFHTVFHPLSSQGVRKIEGELGRELPPVFSDFLSRCNGLNLFSGSLSIDGWRSSYERSGDGAWQPFDIVTPNVHERPRGARPSFVFVGGYYADGSKLYIDKENLKAYRCKQRSAKPLEEWSSFDVMLESEVRRFVTLFDRDGHELDPNGPINRLAALIRGR